MKLRIMAVDDEPSILLLLKAHLESEGIPVYLQYESVGNVYGINIDGIGKVKIKVPAECAEQRTRRKPACPA